MSTFPQDGVPDDILKESVLAQIAATYFSVGKRLERIAKCSATRGFILSALRGDEPLNQNQVANRLGLDRTVVHRAIKSMVGEGLVNEIKASSGRAIHVRLTPKGKRYRERLIQTRMAADESLRQQMTPEEREMLMRLLQRIAQCEF